MIHSPEITIFNVVQSALSVIRKDFRIHAGNEEKTILYKILSGIKVDKIDYYEQGKAIFLAKKDDPRFLEVRYFFDASRASIPTIHVTLPSENPGQDEIGLGEGSGDVDYDDDENTFTKGFIRRFDVVINVCITSNNTFEVLIIYRVLKSLLLALFDHIQLSGLDNPKLAGGDISLDPEVVPDAFGRVLKIMGSYEFETGDIFDNAMLTEIVVSSEIISPMEEDIIINEE